MQSPFRSSLVALSLWLAVSGLPTDSTQRGTSFSCGGDAAPAELSTQDPKKLYESEFTMPMGRQYWSVQYAYFEQPGDSATLRQTTGRMRIEPDREGDGDFDLYVEHYQPGGAPEIHRYSVVYPSAGSLPQFDRMTVDVVKKQASAAALDLVLRATDADREIEYRFTVNGDSGHFERYERRGAEPWRPRFRYTLTR